MNRNLFVVSLIGLLVASLIGVPSWLYFKQWSIYNRQPDRECASSGYNPEGVFHHTACRVWKTHTDELYYALIVGHCEFEPIIPSFTFQRTYSMDDGARLSVNGTPVGYSHPKRLLALNPFGEMQEIELSEGEAQIVSSVKVNEIWESIVLRRLYEFKGTLKEGKRFGTWSCFDKAGNKAYVGDYIEDLRDGQWTYYYPSGQVRAVINYHKGARHGKWTTMNENGAQSVLTWNNDIPVERSASYSTLGRSRVCHPNGNWGVHLGD